MSCATARCVCACVCGWVVCVCVCVCVRVCVCLCVHALYDSLRTSRRGHKGTSFELVGGWGGVGRGGALGVQRPLRARYVMCMLRWCLSPAPGWVCATEPLLVVSPTPMQLVETDRVETGAVLDIKWCVCSLMSDRVCFALPLCGPAGLRRVVVCKGCLHPHPCTQLANVNSCAHSISTQVRACGSAHSHIQSRTRTRNPRIRLLAPPH